MQPLIWYALDRVGYCFPKAREFCALLTASAAAVERAATSSGTMGCMNSKDITPEMREQGKHSAAIDKVIRADKKKYDRTVKILLLGMSGHFIRLFSFPSPLSCCYPVADVFLLSPPQGAGESGKSTIIKQMRIIHSGGFPIDERRQTRAVIYSNMIVAFKLLIEIMEAENISFEHEATEV